ncbi:hypothetical protein A3Q56_01280 [Intoshia linei]|uniref:Transporter n=1 Tax=Intoshia linei TaxID=1819745 RepID=A0A177BBQ0_9BILA|nr:hypothetical protein A3Q56_01280 [Intoshia linei]
MSDQNDRIIEKLDDIENTIGHLAYKVDTLQRLSSQNIANSKNVKLKYTARLSINSDNAKDQNKERGNWSGRFDFVLSILGFAVGLGNVWRFPYLTYKHGGAVFLIPYTIMLFCVGIPIFFLELSLGQYVSRGSMNCWEMAPIFKGVGIAMLYASAMVALYYNVIISWSLYYLFSSFVKILPWQNCDNNWNTEFCYTKLANDSANCATLGYTAFSNGTCYNDENLYGIYNETLAKSHSIVSTLPSKEFFECKMLGYCRSTGIDNIGELDPYLALALLISWILVFTALIKGIKSSGKVVYFTATFPYLILIILLIYGLQLEGASKGIKFYLLNVKIEKLQESEVWIDAAKQIFFSLSASWGGLICLSSYNKFKNNCLRDAIFVSIANCLTSFFAGFVIFSYLGNLAFKKGVSVDNIVDSGLNLAFIVYPEALTHLPYPPVWSILFFLMLITLGLDSEFALVETIGTSFMDQWKILRKQKTLVYGIICTFLFCIGLTMCTDGGFYIFNLIDAFAGGWNVLIIALLECICIGYVYGAANFCDDIKLMLGNNPCYVPWSINHVWWSFCWVFMTPLALMVIIVYITFMYGERVLVNGIIRLGITFVTIFSLMGVSRLSLGRYKYPDWAQAVGWVISSLSVLIIVITALFLLLFTEGSFTERLHYLISPKKDYGPSLPQHRRLVKHLPNISIYPETENKNELFENSNTQDS